MAYIPASFGSEAVTFYVDGLPYMADKSLPNYDKLVEELKKPDADVALLISYTQPAAAIAAAVAAAESLPETHVDYLPAGVVSVTRSSVLYNGEAVTGVLVERILSMLEEGHNVMPMVRFLENLYRNPATYAREELYLWMENNNLPITEDGHFLAYKRVNHDFTSVHDGRTKNDPGRTVSLPREVVDPVRARTCSTGLHFCSYSYLPNFSGAKIILLKINPADVVSIPSDYNNAKGRAWQYEVLRTFDGDAATILWPSVVDPDGNEVEDDSDELEDMISDDDDTLDVTSDLGKTLFSLANELGYTEREDRLQAAYEALTEVWDALDDVYYRSDYGDAVHEPTFEWDGDSFTELTVRDAKRLRDVWVKEVAEKDAAAQQVVADAQAEADEAETAAKAAAQAVRDAQIEVINDLGIIGLRKAAANAKYAEIMGHSPWTGVKSKELRAFLIGTVLYPGKSQVK